jgi:hypothetical protein
MFTQLRTFSTLTVIVLCLSASSARAGIPGIPSIPGVPPVPTVKQATKDVVSKELVKQMGDEFNLDQPLRLSADAEYPTMPTLPGGAFRPVSQNIVKSLFAHAHDGRVGFPAGDYAVTVFAYCMMAHVHPPMRNKFRLTPIQGKWADIASALFARTAYSNNPGDVQILTWSLLAGMKYSELSPKSQHLVDTVLPDFKSRLQTSFYEELQRKWTQISANVPGVPSFDAALGQLGDVGKSIVALRDVRNELMANAADYDRTMMDFANIGVARIPSEPEPTPWSVVQPGVYARLMIKGGYLSAGVLEIRVTHQAVASQRIQVALRGKRGSERNVAAGIGGIVNLGTTGFAGYPGSAMQALGWNPEPQNPPGGGSPGGGAPGGPPQPGGPGQPPGGATPGPGKPPGGATPGPGEPGGGGGGGTGGGSGTGGGNGGDDDNGDASTPCDPPDNMFGVDKGALLGDGPSGMDLGRGKGHGIVCLLLKPFVDLAPLGWPKRGNSEVDYGTVGFSLFGHPQLEHVVVTVRYTYATSWSQQNGYVKKHVTAVIDYGSVSSLCPELQQTLAGNGSPPMPGWLSEAELENRLCITGMQGQTMHINAWVGDGDNVFSQSQAHEVDPTAFLYADSQGHM